MRDEEPDAGSYRASPTRTRTAVLGVPAVVGWAGYLALVLAQMLPVGVVGFVMYIWFGAGLLFLPVIYAGLRYYKTASYVMARAPRACAYSRTTAVVSAICNGVLFAVGAFWLTAELLYLTSPPRPEGRLFSGFITVFASVGLACAWLLHRAARAIEEREKPVIGLSR